MTDTLDDALLRLLRPGRARAVTSRRLRQTLSVELGRRVGDASLRRAAKRLLLAGHPVVSDRNGFYLAEDLAELLAYRDNLDLRMRGLLRDLRAVDNLLKAERVADLFDRRAAQ